MNIMLYPNRFIVVFVLLCVFGSMKSQDVGQLVKAPLLVSNGGFNMSHIFNYSPDSTSRHEPYSYYLSGSFNSTLFGVVNLPFAFAYTNNRVTANLPQPFNRFSLSPSYKWIKTHIGYGSMSFSPYTLAGHEFFGGGVELKPDNGLRFAALYGRLRNAVEPDTMVYEPMYKRMGGGLLVGYEGEKIDISINMFKAKDVVGSLEIVEEPAMKAIAPADNIAGGMAFSYRPGNGFSFKGEYGLSGINHDISIPDSTTKSLGDRFLTSHGNVTVHHAFKTSVAQSTQLGSIGATYERVQPNYQTFGAYYFTNDFENITANLSTSIIRKVSLSLDAGYQRDNLEGQKTNTAKRAIYSANVSAPIKDRLTLGAAFSNVQSYMHIKDVYDEVTRSNQYQNLDTLSFTQLNMAASLNANYILKATEQQRQNINMAFSYQEASEQQEDDRRYVGSRIYNSMLSYLFALTPSRFTVSSTVNHNRNSMPEMEMHVLSFNLSVQKVFAEQFRTAFTGTYSSTFNGDGRMADIINLRLTGGYSLKKRHSFNLSVAMIDNKAQRGHSTNYSANLSYSYIFDLKLLRNNKRFEYEGNF